MKNVNTHTFCILKIHGKGEYIGDFIETTPKMALKDEFVMRGLSVFGTYFGRT